MANHHFHPNDLVIPGASLALTGGLAILGGLRDSAEAAGESLSARLTADQFESALALQDFRINSLVDRAHADARRIENLLLDLEAANADAKRWRALATA
jgi:hypothetical protein